MNDHMNPSQPSQKHILIAKRRMSYLLLLLLVLFFIKATISFPFVDHTSLFQNLIYSLVVTLPFIIINIIFIVLTGKDLVQKHKRHPIVVQGENVTDE